MRIRERIAAWLAPDMADKADRCDWLKGELSYSGARWLGEFKPIAAFVEWLADREHDRYRKLDEPYQPGKWRADISDFRDELRRAVKAEEPKNG
jgi:hypothetical protein